MLSYEKDNAAILNLMQKHIADINRRVKKGQNVADVVANKQHELEALQKVIKTALSGLEYEMKQEGNLLQFSKK